MSDENRYPWETNDPDGVQPADGAQPNTAHTDDASADGAAPARPSDASASPKYKTNRPPPTKAKRGLPGRA